MTGLRQVTGLNTPSVINAVFNHRNFWNGRAQFEFNGVNPFGTRDPNARVLRFDPAAGTTAKVGIILTQASLASQAVGPPNNSVEMSANGRSFAKLGKKMLSLRPLGRQAVAADDSHLAGVRDPSGTGLSTSYSALVQSAFKPEWWGSGVIVDGAGNPVASPTPGSTGQFSQMEFNFSLFWGLAIQLYETQLVSDQTRFDQFLAGNNNALTSQEQQGFSIFGGKGQCAKCHSGPELTSAAVSQVTGNLTQPIGLIGGGSALADTGWFNTGVRPTAEEIGIGGTDPFGNPLSEARRANPAGPLAVDGAVKTPQLRNIELTGPYMHNGGMDTLEQVVDFYSRGGDFADANAPNVSDRIRNLQLSPDEKAALVAFLKSLTDERVRFERGPFDHPSIDVPQGNGPVIRVPAVGRNGRATPLAPFLGQASGH
jgi:cytochrome c peroxidase